MQDNTSPKRIKKLSILKKEYKNLLVNHICSEAISLEDAHKISITAVNILNVSNMTLR